MEILWVMSEGMFVGKCLWFIVDLIENFYGGDLFDC